MALLGRLPPDPGGSSLSTAVYGAADATLVLDAEAIMAVKNDAWLAEAHKNLNAPATPAGS